MNYDDFFHEATKTAQPQKPYPYQRDLALAPNWPEALSAPTGAGKTAAATLGWLYRRRYAPEPVRAATPRRLIFCLPMRTLVTQTCAVINGWLENLGLLETETGLGRGAGVSVHMLLGGHGDSDWRLHPEADAVIVGTQDMILSRALNRGYGCSRFVWPWLYGLLSNDCLWVFDEIQLMGVGLATGLQLAGLRKRLGTFGPTQSLFMSATLDPRWLRTVDHPVSPAVMTLGEADLDHGDLRRRRRASKRLERARTALGKEMDKSVVALAEEILARHQAGTRTLVVLNQVETAVKLCEAIEKRRSKHSVRVVLLHSRFRPPDRDARLREATAKNFDGIVVSTQVIEAGVDVSARTLFTELAPWPSLVQRAGRCNRGAEYEDGAVLWIDHEGERSALPYDPRDLQEARGHLARLAETEQSINPDAIERAAVPLRHDPPEYVIRRRDVLDLFDTTPDLGGLDIDVSRFIREENDNDVQVFWRPLEGDPEARELSPEREELCPAPVAQMRKAVGSGLRAFRWDALEGQWLALRERQIVPGGVYLLRSADGHYTTAHGWSLEAKDRVPPIEQEVRSSPADSQEPEPLDGDPLSEIGGVSLTEHSVDARGEAVRITKALALPDLPVEVIIRAAHAHDLGKAHEVFQQTMQKASPALDTGMLWAKADGRVRHARRGFRHELASALAWLQQDDGEERDLIAYLLAAHHGKVRLSIRALPNDQGPQDGSVLHARGIWHEDPLPAIDLGADLHLPPMKLSLNPMKLGRVDESPSWGERTVALRERLGPFRLAYLEALVRTADVLASMREQAAILSRKRGAHEA